MAQHKKGFTCVTTATAVILTLFCLLENGHALRFEEYSETSFDDWQPSKSSVVKNKPAVVNEAPSPYEEALNDSSPSVGGKYVSSRQRSRERNFPSSFADSQPIRQPIGRSHPTVVDREKIRPVPTNPLRGRSDYARPARPRNNFRAYVTDNPADVKEPARRAEASPPSRRSRTGGHESTGTFKAEDFNNRESGFARRNDDYGTEFPSRRIQNVPKTRVEAQRRISVSTDEAVNPVLADVSESQKPVAFRGRVHYSDPNQINDVRKERTRAFTSRFSPVEPTPLPRSDVSQKAYIVLPENQQTYQQPRINEISSRHQEREAQHNTISNPNHYQKPQYPSVESNPARGGYTQYHVEVIPGTKTAESLSRSPIKPVQPVNRNNNTVSVNYNQTIERPENTVVYQYAQSSSSSSSSSSPDGNGRYQQQTQTNFVPQPVPQQVTLEEVNQVKQFNGPAPQESHLPSTPYIPTTVKSTWLPETRQNFRSRQPVKRIEQVPSTSPAEKSGETVQANYQRHRTNFRRGSKYEATVPANKVNDTDKRISKPVTQGTLGRQRRRQTPAKPNQRVGIYTVLPSNMESVTQSTTTPTITTSRGDKENESLKFNTVRGRSRYQQGAFKGIQSEQAKPMENSLNATEPAQTTQAPTKPTAPTVRAVTRLIARVTPTNKAPESKAEEDIDETANYPKEFLERLKSSKGQVPPPTKIHEVGAASTRISTGSGPIQKGDREKPELQTTTQRGRYSQSFYRKLASKASYNSPPRAKTDDDTNTRFASNKYKPYPSQMTTKKPAPTVTTPGYPVTPADSDVTSTTEGRKKFVPKNKISLEERKHRIELLKEKVRQNATEAEQQKLKESLLTQANTHPGSREMGDAPESFVKKSAASAGSNQTPPEVVNATKHDLITLASEDNVHVLVPAELVPATVTATPPTFSTTAATPNDVGSVTKEPDYSVLNVTLFPSTRHRFSSRINSTTNLTLPQDVELISVSPTPSILNTPEKQFSTDTPLAISLQSLFNSSLNASSAAKSPEILSVTKLFEPSTNSFPVSTTTDIATTVRATTTKRSTTKKKASGRKKSGKKSSSSSRSRPKSPRRSGSSKSQAAKSAISTTTVRTTPQRNTDTDNNNNGEQPLSSLALDDIENIINQTLEVVQNNPMSSPKPATAPRSELNALTPGTTFDRTGTSQNGTSQSAQATSPMTPTNRGGTTNQTGNSGRATADSGVGCIGQSCRNATSQSLHINNQTSATTKSPQALRKLFIFGIFPNDTIQRRPFNESAAQRNLGSGGSGAFRPSSTTTTTTTSAPDYDVFGIYPNNSVVRRRGWKTFDHERYQSPYVIFGIYPNNTIVKKYPNGTTIRDEYLISDNEIRNMMSEQKNQRGCSCANITSNNNIPTSTTTTTERITTASVTTDISINAEGTTKNAKDDAESIDLNTVTEPVGENSQEENAATTARADPTTEPPNENEEDEEDNDEKEEDVEEEENEDETEENGNEEDEEEEDDTTEDSVTTSPVSNRQSRPLGEEFVSTTSQSLEGTTEKLEDIEEIDDASTPLLGIGESTTTQIPNLKQDGLEFDGAYVSTTARVDEKLVDAENIDDAKFRVTTEISTGGTNSPFQSDYKERTTTEKETTTGKTTTEFFYYRPTEFSPLSLDINESAVAKVPPKITTVKPTTQKPKTDQKRFGLFRNNLLGNLLANLGLLDQPKPKPSSQSRPFSSATKKPTASLPDQSTSQKADSKNSGRKTVVNLQPASPRPKSPEQGFTIDLFGLGNLESTTGETTDKPPTTPNNVPTATFSSPTSTILTPIEIIKKDDQKEVEILQGLKNNGIDNGLVSTTVQSLSDLGQLGEIRTTIGPPTLHFVQGSNHPTAPYAFERVTTEPLFNFDSPTERPLSGSGIVSITYDDDIFENQTPRGLQAYQLGQSTISQGLQSFHVGHPATLNDIQIYQTGQPTTPRGLRSFPTKPTTVNEFLGYPTGKPSTVKEFRAYRTEKPKTHRNSEQTTTTKKFSDHQTEEATTQGKVSKSQTESTTSNELEAYQSEPTTTMAGFQDHQNEKETTAKSYEADETTEQTTTSSNIQIITSRPYTQLEDRTDPTGPQLDIRELGDLITRLTTNGNSEGTEFGLSGQSAQTTESYGSETTTTPANNLLNALLPLSVEYIQSAIDGNTIRKRQRKPTKDLDEPSSLTNIAFRALSSTDENPIPDVLATTTTTTTPTPTTMRPKKTKVNTSSGRIKMKKVKNLSRTSVKAFKNMTSTPLLPESVFIVTPMPRKVGLGDDGSVDGDPLPGPRSDSEVKRPKVKFVTLTPGFVVTTNVQNRNENEVLSLSSRHVQKVTKAPANIPDNFLSTVYGEIEERASSPIPEILKNVGNDLDGDGLSVSLAKRIITLALEKAISNSTTQNTSKLETTSGYPTTSDLPTSTPLIHITSLKPQPTTKKAAVTTKEPKPTSKKPITTITTTTTTAAEKPRPTVTTTTKRQTQSTTTFRTTTTISTTTIPWSPTEAIFITPKKSSQTSGQIPSEVLGTETLRDKIPDKLSNLDPINDLFDKIPTKEPSSNKVTEDLNALLSGLWQEGTTTAPKMQAQMLDANLIKTQPKTKKVKEERITLPKKASDSLSESDLRLLESILSQQGVSGGTQDLEQIVQNQIRLAEEVRKASRNLKKKQKTTTTTTTTTPRPSSGGLGFLLSLFGSQGPSNPPVRSSKRPQKPSQSESYTSLNNTPDPINELDEDFVTADRTARGELVTAAIDVTKAVSKFMGTVLTSAAQSFQNFVRSLRS